MKKKELEQLVDFLKSQSPGIAHADTRPGRGPHYNAFALAPDDVRRLIGFLSGHQVGETYSVHMTGRGHTPPLAPLTLTRTASGGILFELQGKEGS